MTGALIREQKIELREFPDPEPGAGRVVVRLKATTLCGSDLKMYNSTRQERQTGRDTWGYIGGHESCGVVEKLGPGTKGLKVGDRVIVYHIEGCGYCRFCTAGWMLHCESPEKVSYGYDAHGGLAPFMLAKDVNCVPLPEGLSFADGACCACGTGTAFQSLRRIAVSGCDRFVAYGLGPVGLSAVMLAAAMGAEVTGVDLVAERLKLARELGAGRVIDATKEDPVQVVREMTGGAGAETAADFSGHPDARNQALDCVGVWGRVALVGEGNATTFYPSPQILHRQLTVVGSWVYGLWQLHELTEFLVRQDLHPERMVTHRFALEEAEQAFQTFSTRRSGKVMIEFP